MVVPPPVGAVRATPDLLPRRIVGFRRARKESDDFTRAPRAKRTQHPSRAPAPSTAPPQACPDHRARTTSLPGARLPLKSLENANSPDARSPERGEGAVPSSPLRGERVVPSRRSASGGCARLERRAPHRSSIPVPPARREGAPPTFDPRRAARHLSSPLNSPHPRVPLAPHRWLLAALHRSSSRSI